MAGQVPDCLSNYGDRFAVVIYALHPFQRQVETTLLIGLAMQEEYRLRQGKKWNKPTNTETDPFNSSRPLASDFPPPHGHALWLDNQLKPG